MSANPIIFHISSNICYFTTKLGNPCNPRINLSQINVKKN